MVKKKNFDKLIINMWNENPEMRPNIEYILEFLKIINLKNEIII